MPPAPDLLDDPLLRTAPVIEGFKVLPPVVLYSKLGQGGMGAVYRGHHVKLDLPVAVKCLKPELTSEDGEYVKRFQREARLAAGIVHQNVVSVKEVHETHGIHYLVMELVKGETARERVKRKGKLAEPEALAIAFGVARGLHEAHSRGIVHRDLKPDNVLISVDGVVKLADLGLAKGVFGGDEAGLSLATSVVMGTPQYMPPEQWESPDVGPPADIWAFGATLYYLLAGESAIAQASMLQMARRIQEHDFPSLRALRPDVREEVHALIERCTRRKPEERYADVRAVLKALRPLVSDDDESLHDPDTGRGSLRVATVTPPPRAALLKIKQAVIASEPRIEPLLAGAAQAEPTPTITAPPRRAWPEMPPPRRSVRGVAVALGALLLALSGGGYGYAAGWFAGAPPAGRVPAPGVDEKKGRKPVEDAPLAKPSDPPAAEAAANAAANARTLLQRALQAMPRADGLDPAIADLESALQMDPRLDEARLPLARALRRKAEKLEPTDLDAAYERSVRAQQLAPQDSDVAGLAARLRDALVARLRQGITVTAPRLDQLLKTREVSVRGSVAATNLRTLRVVLDARQDAAEQPFPDELARTVDVVGGEFDVKLVASQDGPCWLRLLAIDQFDLRAEVLPVRLRVDTVRPVIELTSPAQPLTTRDDEITIGGTVRDDTAVKLTLDARSLPVDGKGAFTTTVGLPADRGYEFVLVATDAAGNSTQQKVAVTRKSGPQPGEAITTGIGLVMLYVQPQEFTMGSPVGEPGRDSDEQQHKVKISKGYWLGETEVTQGQWKAVMGTAPWQGKSLTQEGDAVAASYVSWNDAMAFCRKLTDLEREARRLPDGYRYILPTEAEWELACRAGSTTAYCFGDDVSELAKYAVYSGARAGDYAHVVQQQRKANRWGFFDMHGNVWEWCLDGRGDGAEETYVDGIVDPPRSVGGPQRVLRGGSWYFSAPPLRSADRDGYGPGFARSILGFRPALSARSDVK